MVTDGYIPGYRENARAWPLDRIVMRPGWRSSDLDYGPAGLLDLRSERVG